MGRFALRNSCPLFFKQKLTRKLQEYQSGLKLAFFLMKFFYLELKDKYMIEYEGGNISACFCLGIRVWLSA